MILCVAGSGTASEFGAENGASLTSLCFFTALGSPGGYAVAVCVVLFAFSTMVGWEINYESAFFYIFPKLDVEKFQIRDDRKFASDLLHATDILIVPGSGFDWPRPDHFRIVMLPQAEVLSDAVRRMGEFLDGYRQK